MKGLWLLTAMTISALSLAQQSTGQVGPTDRGREEKTSVGALQLYGPGGPLGPMRECGQVFSKKTGIDVQITTGTPPQWIELAQQNGDLIFEGAEYMLNDFMRSAPGMINESSIIGLYARSAAILVRKGNPKRIATLEDLARDGVKVMVVTQEKMEEVYGHVPGIQYNVVKPVLTGAEATQIWKTMPELDAWITYESWFHTLKEEADLIQLTAKERILRITPVARIGTLRDKKLAEEFLNFLRSDEAHRIFQKWGWK